MRRRIDLRRYQHRFVKLIKIVRHIFLALDMGAGKTAICLTAIRDLLDEFAVRRVLIVAPLEVARSTWPDEIREWEHTRALTFSVAVGTERERIAALEADTEIVIINRENVQWLYRYYGLRNWPFDMLVYDEASRLKGGRRRTNGKAKVGKRITEFGALCKVTHKFDYIVELSGTPSPNGLHDLWGPIYLLDLGERLGETRSSFESRWFDKGYMGWEMKPHPFAYKQIMRRISDVMFSLDESEYPELPPMVMNNRYVRLPKNLMDEYKRFERTQVSMLYDVEAVNRGVLSNKLLQFANGSMYRMNEDVHPPRKEIIDIHDLKLDALDSIIQEAAGKPVLVAYTFKFDKAKIKKRFKHAVFFEDEPDFVKKWNAGKISLGVSHPASIGHGLNLQHGGNIAVWYGVIASLEIYQQFNKRLHRPGQKNTVFMHHILAKGTADEDTLLALSDKNATQEAVIKAVVDRIKRLG